MDRTATVTGLAVTGLAVTGLAVTGLIGGADGGSRDLAADRIAHGRYQLGDVIGAGGFGQVHRAIDTVTGDAVAVKLVPARSAAELAQGRRELAALRWLRLPGVIRLRDDGIEDGTWFLVMDLVDGAPFDRVLADGWAAAEPAVLALLEILARVHLAGVVHLDLKPSNILVDAAGQVVVLDFGIARGTAMVGAPASTAGTPRYMAPEQLRGEPCDARADLYALGRMLSAVDGAPPAIVALLGAMTDEAVDARPTSALEVYAAIAGRSPFPAWISATAPWTRAALRARFAGPDGFTHTVTDAVDLLWGDTGGDPARVRDALVDWLMSGVAHWHDGRLSTTRAALQRRTLDLDLLGAPIDVLAPEARAECRRLRLRGQLDRALALAGAVLSITPAGTLHDGLVIEHVLAGLAFERIDAVDLSLHVVERAASVASTDRVWHLLRLARAVLRRDRDLTELAAAVDRPFPLEDLETWRIGLRARAREIAGLPETGEADVWSAGDAQRRARVAHWHATRAYRDGGYDEAGRLWEAASAVKDAPIDRLSSTICAAWAWLDGLALARAADRAREARQLAFELRHPTFEARAAWILRAVAYRSGRPDPVDPAMIDAGAALGPYYEALFAVTDAATALRDGDRDTARDLALRAARGFRLGGMAPAELLARSVAGYAGAPVDWDALAAEAAGCAVPELGVQALAFARWSRVDPDPAWLDRARALARARPP
ncbi:MAG: serine/threonine-protein kinase, partial [Myxococcota bacterium]